MVTSTPPPSVVVGTNNMESPRATWSIRRNPPVVSNMYDVGEGRRGAIPSIGCAFVVCGVEENGDGVEDYSHVLRCVSTLARSIFGGDSS